MEDSDIDELVFSSLELFSIAFNSLSNCVVIEIYCKSDYLNYFLAFLMLSYVP